jgi:acetoin utilization protein AcuC
MNHLKVGFAYSEKYTQYDLGPGHPFRGDRFDNAFRFFEAHGLFQQPNIVMLKPEFALKQDILRVHEENYVNLIYNLAEKGQSYDIETPVSPKILEAILLITGGAIEAGKAICDRRVGRAVALGSGYHHAGPNYGGGFCLFNDIAVMVEYLREKFGLERVAIIDYDVHFGNGTSDIYCEDPNVLFISLHQDPKTIYPGTGFVKQIGRGAGEGYNVNVPLPPQTCDESYIYALKEIFVPLTEEFKPDIIVGNGGSDPHFADALGNLGLTVQGFFNISQTIVATSEKVCQGKVVLMPGSGYTPEVLPQCWYALVSGIFGLESIDIRDPYTPPVEPRYVRPKIEDTLNSLKRLLKKYWNCF